MTSKPPSIITRSRKKSTTSHSQVRRNPEIIHFPHFNLNTPELQMCSDERLKKTLLWGNIYSALEMKYLDVESVLNWLSSITLNDKNLSINHLLISVYRALCLYSSEDEQYFTTDPVETVHDILNPELMENVREHFLERNPHPAYQQIYILTHQKKEINNTLAPLLASQMINILQEKYHPLVEKYIPNHEDLLLRDRKFKDFFSNHLSFYSKYEFFEEYIIELTKEAIKYEHIDWILDHLEQFKKNIKNYQDVIINSILEYSRRIRKCYMEYWEKVVKPRSLKLINQLTPDLSGKIKLREGYPELYSELENLSPLAIKVLKEKNDAVRGYLLGFPIQRYLPNEKEIISAAKLLSEIGVEKYCDLIRKHNKEWITMSCRNHGVPSYWSPEGEDIYDEVPLNEEDVLYESIYDYSPFDIVLAQMGYKFHVFCRPELNKILSTKLNPYNKTEIDPSIISIGGDLIKRSKIMRLPKPAILTSLLDSVEKGELTYDEETFPDLRRLAEIISRDFNSITSLTDRPVLTFSLREINSES